MNCVSVAPEGRSCSSGIVYGIMWLLGFDVVPTLLYLNWHHRCYIKLRKRETTDKIILIWRTLWL